MARPKKDTQDDDVIRDFDERIESGRDLEGFISVPGRVSKNLSVVYSLRLSPEEFTLFEQAAKARGVPLSDFLRAAAHGAVEGDIDADRAAALNLVREKVRELNDAVSRV